MSNFHHRLVISVIFIFRGVRDTNSGPSQVLTSRLDRKRSSSCFSFGQYRVPILEDDSDDFSPQGIYVRYKRYAFVIFSVSDQKLIIWDPDPDP